MWQPIATAHMRTALLVSMISSMLLVMSISAADAVDAVPNLDVNRSCKAETADEPDSTKKRCLTDETAARDKLAQQWIQFSVSDRRECTQTATLGGSASYVELLTCLEMAAFAKKLPKDVTK